MNTEEAGEGGERRPALGHGGADAGALLESYSKHGYKPSCVIFDELHAQPDQKLWDVMTGAAGAAHDQPVWIVLTTAGDDPDRHSIGWEIHERAVAIRDARQLRRILAEGVTPDRCSPAEGGGGRPPGPRRPLLEQDESNWLPVLYGLTAMFGDDPDDLDRVDIWDEALWYRCNPSLGKHLTLRALRLEAQAAKKSPAAEKLFRWLRLNQWISVKAVGWLPLTLYDKTQWNRPEWKVLSARSGGRRHGVSEGKKCYGGLDLSTTTDLTALALSLPAPGGAGELGGPVLGLAAGGRDPGGGAAGSRPIPGLGPGGLPGAVPRGYGGLLHGGGDGGRCGGGGSSWTPWAWTYLSRTPDAPAHGAAYPGDRGATGHENLSPAMKEAERLIRAHQMLHEHNTCARWNFGNVRCYADINENIRPHKQRSIGRIDTTVAWIICGPWRW